MLLSRAMSQMQDIDIISQSIWLEPIQIFQYIPSLGSIHKNICLWFHELAS